MTWEAWFYHWGLEITIVSVIVSLLGLVLMRFAVIYMPADYFVRHGPTPDRWIGHHPILRWTMLIAKNFLGAFFLLLGVLMLMIPGPGVLMMLIGLSLVDVPGKRGAERWLISIGPVHRKIDKMRVQHGQPPLQLVVPQLGHDPNVAAAGSRGAK